MRDDVIKYAKSRGFVEAKRAVGCLDCGKVRIAPNDTLVSVLVFDKKIGYGCLVWEATFTETTPLGVIIYAIKAALSENE